MTKNSKINIKDLFLGLQKSMKENLELIRSNVPHEPTKGDGSENIWISFLKKYLPKRYSVTKGTIIDFEGNRSDAIDIIVFDKQYTPFILNKKGVTYLPVESVYAVFEAKQDVNKFNLEYASDKIESVRVLNRTSAPVVDRGIVRDAPKLFDIMGGMLCLENTWANSIESSKPFISCYNNLKGSKKINIGCVLNDKSFVFDDKKLNYSTDNESLIFFFLKLVLELQKLGTVRPIDLNKYIDQLDSQL